VPDHRLHACLFTLALFAATPALPQDSASPQVECGGQYDCVEMRPIGEAEARASYAHRQRAGTPAPERTEARPEKPSETAEPSAPATALRSDGMPPAHAREAGHR
jgi:hypothetical protein